MHTLQQHQLQYQDALAVAFGMDPAQLRGVNKPAFMDDTAHMGI